MQRLADAVQVTLGLRERKKLATRDALAAAALALAIERGPDNVTVEDIAQAADVSPRTFFNHFASKEEAFVAEDLQKGRELLDRVRAEPLDQPVWPMISRVMGDHLEGAARSREEARAHQVVKKSPSVLTQQFLQYSSLEQDLLLEINRRLPAHASPLEARLIAGVVVAALRAAADTWLSDGNTQELRPLFDDAVATLAPAFPSR